MVTVERIIQEQRNQIFSLQFDIARLVELLEAAGIDPQLAQSDSDAATIIFSDSESDSDSKEKAAVLSNEMEE